MNSLVLNQDLPQINENIWSFDSKNDSVSGESNNNSFSSFNESNDATQNNDWPEDDSTIFLESTDDFANLDSKT